MALELTSSCRQQASTYSSLTFILSSSLTEEQDSTAATPLLSYINGGTEWGSDAVRKYTLTVSHSWTGGVCMEVQVHMLLDKKPYITRSSEWPYPWTVALISHYTILMFQFSYTHNCTYNIPVLQTERTYVHAMNNYSGSDTGEPNIYYTRLTKHTT